MEQQPAVDGVELAVYVPTADGRPLSARRASAVLRYLLQLLGNLDRGAAHDEWAVSELRLGSLALALTPDTNVISPARLRRVETLAERVVDGVNRAAQSDSMPADWSQTATRNALALVKAMGPDGTLAVRRRGEESGRVTASAAVIRGFEESLKARSHSFGSLVGHLRELDENKRTRLSATLSVVDPAIDITVHFDERQAEAVQQAWRSRRVEVTGIIDEDLYGVPLAVWLEDIEVLPERSALRLEDLQGGFYPNITGGLSADEYLEIVRGER